MYIMYVCVRACVCGWVGGWVWVGVGMWCVIYNNVFIDMKTLTLHAHTGCLSLQGEDVVFRWHV